MLYIFSVFKNMFIVNLSEIYSALGYEISWKLAFIIDFFTNNELFSHQHLLNDRKSHF